MDDDEAAAAAHVRLERLAGGRGPGGGPVAEVAHHDRIVTEGGGEAGVFTFGGMRPDVDGESARILEPLPHPFRGLRPVVVVVLPVHDERPERLGRCQGHGVCADAADDEGENEAMHEGKSGVGMAKESTPAPDR